MRKIINVYWLLIAFEALLPSAGSALDLAGFARCIGAEGQGPVCQLDAGTYSISSTLQIARSSITLKGTILDSRADTVLKRAPGFTGPLLADPFSVTSTPILSSITIRDLTFNGNRGQQSGSGFFDVLIVTTRSLLVTNCDFVGSAGVGLEIRQAASGVVVNNSHFGHPAILGLALAPNTPMQDDAAYALCETYPLPAGVVITNSSFEDAGANAIWTQARNVRILNTIFRHNHIEAPFNTAGGQIDIEECTDNIAVLNSTFQDGPDTPNGWWAEGIEVAGTNVTLVDNLVTNNAGNGIALTNVREFFLANWDPQTGVIASGYRGVGGVSILNHLDWRPTGLIVIDHANIINSHGHGVEFTNGMPDVPIEHVTLTNSCLAGNTHGPWDLSGLGQNVSIANNETSNCGPE